jgi:hypothetical protein
VIAATPAAADVVSTVTIHREAHPLRIQGVVNAESHPRKCERDRRVKLGYDHGPGGFVGVAVDTTNDKGHYVFYWTGSGAIPSGDYMAQASRTRAGGVTCRRATSDVLHVG